MSFDEYFRERPLSDVGPRHVDGSVYDEDVDETGGLVSMFMPKERVSYPLPTDLLEEVSRRVQGSVDRLRKEQNSYSERRNRDIPLNQKEHKAQALYWGNVAHSTKSPRPRRRGYYIPASAKVEPPPSTYHANASLARHACDYARIEGKYSQIRPSRDEGRSLVKARIREFDQAMSKRDSNWGFMQRMRTAFDPRIALWDSQARCAYALWGQISPELAELIDPSSSSAEGVVSILSLCSCLTMLEMDLKRTKRTGKCVTPQREATFWDKARKVMSSTSVGHIGSAVLSSAVTTGQSARDVLSECGEEVAQEFAQTIKTNQLDEAISDRAIEVDLASITTEDRCSFQENQLVSKQALLKKDLDALAPLNADLEEKVVYIERMRREVDRLKAIETLVIQNPRVTSA